MHTLEHTAQDVVVALGRIVVFFLARQFLCPKLPAKRLKGIAVGVVFTYIGLVVFITGVTVGYKNNGEDRGFPQRS